MNVVGLTSVVGVFALTTGCVASEYVPRINEVPVEFVEELGRLVDGFVVHGDVSLSDAIIVGEAPTTEAAVREAILAMASQSECPVIGAVVGEFFVDSTINATGTYRLASFDNDNEIVAAGDGVYKTAIDGSASGNFVGEYNISSDDIGKLLGGYVMQDLEGIGGVGVIDGSWESTDFSDREVDFGYIRGLWVPAIGTNAGYIVGFSADCALSF